MGMVTALTTKQCSISKCFLSKVYASDGILLNYMYFLMVHFLYRNLTFKVFFGTYLQGCWTERSHSRESQSPGGLPEFSSSVAVFPSGCFSAWFPGEIKQWWVGGESDFTAPFLSLAALTQMWPCDVNLSQATKFPLTWLSIFILPHQMISRRKASLLLGLSSTGRTQRLLEQSQPRQPAFSPSWRWSSLDPGINSTLWNLWSNYAHCRSYRDAIIIQMEIWLIGVGYVPQNPQGVQGLHWEGKTAPSHSFQWLFEMVDPHMGKEEKSHGNIVSVN